MSWEILSVGRAMGKWKRIDEDTFILEVIGVIHEGITTSLLSKQVGLVGKKR